MASSRKPPQPLAAGLDDAAAQFAVGRGDAAVAAFGLQAPSQAAVSSRSSSWAAAESSPSRASSPAAGRLHPRQPHLALHRLVVVQVDRQQQRPQGHALDDQGAQHHGEGASTIRSR